MFENSTTNQTTLSTHYISSNSHSHTHLFIYTIYTMAAVLEIVTIPRATASLAAPVVHSSIFSVSSRRLKLSDFNGIRLRPTQASVSFGSASKLPLPRTRITCEARGASVQVAPVSDDAWQSLVLESDLPVLVEFWAPWCGPCRMIHPVIDELAKEYTGKLKCYKVNTDECPNIATNYGIRSIPTVMVFKNGEKKDAVIGAVPKTTLCTCIEKFL